MQRIPLLAKEGWTRHQKDDAEGHQSWRGRGGPALISAKDGLRFWQTSLLIAASILAGIGMWGYFDGVAVDAQEAKAAAQNIPRGNLSDLYPRWLGTREFLLHGRDPYSAEVTAEINKAASGVPMVHRKPGNRTDENGFALPLSV